MSTSKTAAMIEKVAAQKEEAKEPTLFSLGKKKSAFMRKLQSYNRFKDKIVCDLKGEKEAAAEDPSDESKPARKTFSKVHNCYKLIRNFSLTFNWLKLSYDERKESVIFIPSEFEAELEKILSKDICAKFLKCMTGPIEDIEANLPADFDDARVQKVLKFVDAKDQVHVIDRLQKEIDRVSEEFAALKAIKDAEPKPEIKEKSKSKKKEKDDKKSITSGSKGKGGEFNAEESFKDMISQIKKRIGTIRF